MCLVYYQQYFVLTGDVWTFGLVSGGESPGSLVLFMGTGGLFLPRWESAYNSNWIYSKQMMKLTKLDEPIPFGFSLTGGLL